MEAPRPPRPPEDRAKEAFKVSNDIAIDLAVGPSLYRTYFTQQAALPPSERRDLRDAAVRRMLVFHVVITLAKWTEFYRRYGSILPADSAPRARALDAEIRSKGVKEFRDTVAAHIWDDDDERAPTAAEIQSRLDRITGGDTRSFMNSVSNLPGVEDEVGRVEDTVDRITFVRDSLQREYGLDESALFGGPKDGE
jgi:hypothetical protein